MSHLAPPPLWEELGWRSGHLSLGSYHYQAGWPSARAPFCASIPPIYEAGVMDSCLLMRKDGRESWVPGGEQVTS